MLFVLNILYPLLIIIVNKEFSNLLQDIHNWVYSWVKEHFVNYYVNFHLKSLQAICRAVHCELLAHFLATTCKPRTLVNSLQTSSSQFANYPCKLGLLAHIGGNKTEIFQYTVLASIKSFFNFSINSSIIGSV